MLTRISEAEESRFEIDIDQVSFNILMTQNILEKFYVTILVTYKKCSLFPVFTIVKVLSEILQFIFGEAFGDCKWGRGLMNDWIDRCRKCEPEVEVVLFQILQFIKWDEIEFTQMAL